MEGEAHPDIEHLSFLLGTWAGEGEGSYPSIQLFRYREEVRFWHVGKPFIACSQRTWALDDGRPLHSEMGYWRPQPGAGVEVVLAHPTGIVEIEVGAVAGGRTELISERVACSPSGKDVQRLERSFLVSGTTLTYDLRMAAVGEPVTHHLHAELGRIA